MRVDSRHAIKPRVSLSDIGLDGAEGSVQLDNGDAVLRVESGSVVVNSASRAGPYVSTSIGPGEPIMLCDGDTVSGATKVATFQQMPADSPRKRAHESSDDSGDETDVDEAPAPAPVVAPVAAPAAASYAGRDNNGFGDFGGAAACSSAASSFVAAPAAASSSGAAAATHGLMDGPKPLRAGLPELKMSDQFDWNKRNGQARGGARAPPPDRPIAGAVDLELKDVRGGTRRLDEFVAMEKFDGVRVLWNGHTRAWYTKAGERAAKMPASLAAMLPDDMWLDGELWAGRNRFQSVMAMINAKEATDEYWESLKFVVYDAPLAKWPDDHEHAGRPMGIADRLDAARAALKARGADPQRVEVVDAFACRCSGDCIGSLVNRDGKNVQACAGFHAGNPGCPAEFLSRVVAARGEGLILRHARSRFKRGKHKDRDVLKVKLRYDHEAVVIGAWTGDRQSLRVLTFNHPCEGGPRACDCRGGEVGEQHVVDVNWEFDAGRGKASCPSHWVRSDLNSGMWHPPPGTVITYQYQRGLESGHPRHVHYQCEHPDTSEHARSEACARARARQVAEGHLMIGRKATVQPEEGDGAMSE